MKLISFVVPVFNEEDNVRPLYDAVCNVMRLLSDRYAFEIVFTDNRSTDETFPRLVGLASQDPRVRVFRFSRNFGYQRSIHTGYAKARGDAAIQLDCDLQDPPEMIPLFLEKWEKGAAVVYGVRRKRKESALMRGMRKLFYRLVDSLSADPLPHDAGDFRLVDRRILDALRVMNDQQPYLRGMIAGMGFEQVGIPYDRNARERGHTKFSLKQLFGFAFSGIFSQSIVPLRVATYFGLLISLVTMVGGGVYLVGRFAYGRDWPAGFATTTILMLMSLSIISFFLGIIGEYLGRIYEQVRSRPLTIIEHEVDGVAQGLHERVDGQTPESPAHREP